MLKTEMLREKLPSAEELLHALGLQYAQSSTHYVNTLAVFALGAMTGAALALLLAPASGRQLREDVREQVTAWREGIAPGTSPHRDATRPTP